MNQERRSVESPQTNAIPLPAISLPVAERQGYHQLTTAPVSRSSRSDDETATSAETMMPRVGLLSDRHSTTATDQAIGAPR